jgi:hypothetical protein
MPTKPRINPRITHTAEPLKNGGFFISGMAGNTFIQDKDDAEAIAYALNMAGKIQDIRHKAGKLANEAEAFFEATK